MTYKSLPNFRDHRSDNGRSNQMEDAPADRGVLPSYESLAGLPPATNSTPPDTTGSYDFKEDNWESVRPGRSQIFSRFFSDESDEGQGWAVLGLRMVPDPGARCYKEAPWAALLDVRTADMAPLMREGFFWSAEDILPEEGYISRETKPGWAKFGFCHKRTWVLADKSNDEVPRWVGRLDVFTPTLEILPSFPVQHLTRENVPFWAGGRGQERKGCLQLLLHCGWTVWMSHLRTFPSVALNLAHLRMTFPNLWNLKKPKSPTNLNILINSRQVVSFYSVEELSYSLKDELPAGARLKRLIQFLVLCGG
ncbi:hypothetical protein B0I37DRAFT_393656 [Chaetomium sp. MPI-CAGE-AT-0009]|nr:hypothetical protein B0I37DRAFT_393656 [Chaetomium sp. MPI-CAGE-AT-0009]